MQTECEITDYGFKSHAALLIDLIVQWNVLQFQCKAYIPYMCLTFPKHDSENLHHSPIHKQRIET
jgi:hypothetical protein